MYESKMTSIMNAQKRDMEELCQKSEKNVPFIVPRVQ